MVVETACVVIFLTIISNHTGESGAGVQNPLYDGMDFLTENGPDTRVHWQRDQRIGKSFGIRIIIIVP